jgi:hypothetical protein
MSSDDNLKTLSKKELVTLARRSKRRLPCSSLLTGTLFLPQTYMTWDVWIDDLSTTGVGVMASENIEVGQEVIIRLKRTKAISMIPFRAQVIHCTMESECCVRIGCQFEEPIDSVLWEYLIG